MRVGGLDETPDEVLRRAAAYLSNPPEGKPYAYPYYDTYRTNDDPRTLADGDLLAPLLLNAPPDLTAYRTLCGWRDALEKRLGELCDFVDGTNTQADVHTLVG